EAGLGIPELPVRDPFWHQELDKPTIAAVNGYAFGGGFYFASRADFRVAIPSALFEITEVAHGMAVGHDVVLLRENLPYAIAAELAAGGRVTAERLYQVGFINRLAEPEQLLATAVAFAEEILRRPPLAVDYNLRLLRALSRLPMPAEVRERADQYNRELQRSEDLQESLRAFLAHRLPVYRGR